MRQQSRFPKVQLPEQGSIIMSISKSALLIVWVLLLCGNSTGGWWCNSKLPVHTEPQIPACTFQHHQLRLIKSSVSCLCLYSGLDSRGWLLCGRNSGWPLCVRVCACGRPCVCVCVSSCQVIILLKIRSSQISGELKLDNNAGRDVHTLTLISWRICITLAHVMSERDVLASRELKF